MYFPDYGYGLHRLLYVSQALPSAALDEAAMVELVAKSAANNRAKAVTGALLDWDGWFIQVLEGSRDVVKPLFERIAADTRHTAVTLRSVDPAAKRVFGRWDMKRVSAPASAAGFDIATASNEDLHAFLRLSARTRMATAA